MARIIDIEGVGAALAEKFKANGIDTTEELLEAGGTPAGRRSLAEKMGISEKSVLEYVNRADLDRINGIGSEFADLMERCGVDSVPELARRNAENLHKAISEYVESHKNVVRRIPSVSQLQKMIDEAKTLDRKVHH